jgi:hypothetical protein
MYGEEFYPGRNFQAFSSSRQRPLATGHGLIGLIRIKIGCALGHPLRGTHKKMNGSDEQEWRGFVRLKHHSHEFEKKLFS